MGNQGIVLAGLTQAAAVLLVKYLTPRVRPPVVSSTVPDISFQRRPMVFANLAGRE